MECTVSIMMKNVDSRKMLLLKNNFIVFFILETSRCKNEELYFSYIQKQSLLMLYIENSLMKEPAFVEDRQ
jgi:hypothetical protein